MRAVIAMTSIVSVAACGARHLAPPSAEYSTHTTLLATGIRVTVPVHVRCGESEFQPMGPADLDGDGRLERIGTRWDGRGYAVNRYELPSLRELSREHIAADQMELVVARASEGAAGDAWLHPGRLVNASASEWRFDMRVVGRGASRPIWYSHRSGRPNSRIDLDGDGRADPIFDDGRAWIGGRLVNIALHASGRQVHGLPVGYGRERAVDFDGDGAQEVIADTTDGLRVVSVPSFRTLVHRPSRETLSEVISWGGRYFIYSYDVPAAAGHLYSVAAGRLRDVLSWPDVTRPRGNVDPAGDGSLLAIDVVHRTELRTLSAPAIRRLDMELVGSADPAIARLGPVRVDGDERPDIIGLRYLSHGDAAQGGSGETRYEIVLLGRRANGPPRVIRRGEIEGAGSVGVGALDLDGDGRYELLLEERSAYANCEVDSGGAASSRWILIDGEGRELWTDEMRSRNFGDDSDYDETASAAVVDLSGDGTRAIRLRTRDTEWYVLPERSPVPSAIPTCIE